MLHSKVIWSLTWSTPRGISSGVTPLLEGLAASAEHLEAVNDLAAGESLPGGPPRGPFGGVLCRPSLCRALCGGARQLVWVRKKLFNVLRKVLYVIRVRVVLCSGFQKTHDRSLRGMPADCVRLREIASALRSN